MGKISLQKNTKTATMSQLFENFISAKKIDNLSEETIYYYQECFKFFSELFEPENLCSEITRETYLEYVKFLKENKDIKM